MKPHRKIDLVFNSFGDSLGLKHQDGIMWHWGLRIDESIYEVGGMQSLFMAVVGPNGVVATSSPWAEEIRTNIKKFDGYLTLSQKTSNTDQEIEEFTCRWVKQHPAYNPLGPNCQTYVSDLFNFLTGEDLPFAKSQDKVTNPSAWAPGGSKGLGGPEVNPSAVWMRPDKKPFTTPEDGRPDPAGPGGQPFFGAPFASALLGGLEKLAQSTSIYARLGWPNKCGTKLAWRQVSKLAQSTSIYARLGWPSKGGTKLAWRQVSKLAQSWLKSSRDRQTILWSRAPQRSMAG